MRSGGEFFPGARGWAAIPTLAIAAGLLAMMGSANVELLKGRTILFGLAVGLVALFVLGAAKLIEVQRQSRSGQRP
jgi:hypothetical protein